MDILFTHTYFYKMDKKQWRNQTPFPPLGTIYAAAFLRKNNLKEGMFDPKKIPVRVKEKLSNRLDEIIKIMMI